MINIELPSFFTILLIIITSILILLKLTNNLSSRLPPGPWKLPLVGNMHQLGQGLPHIVLRDLAKKYGPIMHLKIGEVSAVVVSNPEMAKEVMKTHDINFASRPPVVTVRVLSYDFKSITFSPYGEYWRQLRKICIIELLSVKRVQSFKSIREDEFSSLVRWITSNAGSAINLTEKVISTTFSVITTAAVGKLKSEEREELIKAINGGVEFAAGLNVADVFPSLKFLHYICGLNHRLEKLKSQSDTILENIIQEHKRRNSSTVDDQERDEDLVDVLLKYHEKETGFSLNTDNIKAIILDVFAAGGETSTTTVDWAMCEMLKKPNVLKKAQDEVRQVFNDKGYVDEENFHELKYLKAVIKETLRLHPAVPLLLPRVCTETCEIKGYEIPVNTKVLVNAYAIGRDPKYWEDPESFEPERFLDSSIEFKGTNFEYIPFGAGRRICPGMSFGLANIELPLAKFLYHFDWNLPNGMKHEDLDMAGAFGVTARRKSDLYVIPVVYKPVAVREV